MILLKRVLQGHLPDPRCAATYLLGQSEKNPSFDKQACGPKGASEKREEKVPTSVCLHHTLMFLRCAFVKWSHAFCLEAERYTATICSTAVSNRQAKPGHKYHSERTRERSKRAGSSRQSGKSVCHDSYGEVGCVKATANNGAQERAHAMELREKEAQCESSPCLFLQPGGNLGNT